MNETPSAAIARIGTSPLKRLAWAVDFSQRTILSENISNAILELNCFVFAPHLFPNRPRQINALMTNPVWKDHRYGREELAEMQRRFLDVLNTVCGKGKIELSLDYVIANFTRNEGLQYVSRFPGWSADGSITDKQRTEAKLEMATLKFLRLLDETVRSKGGQRLTPLRQYVGICPKVKDGCGRLFAKTRIDQEHCTRTCAVRHQVYRFRMGRAKQKRKKTLR